MVTTEVKRRGRPTGTGSIMRVRVSDPVRARLEAQAALYGMSTGVYAAWVVAQATLAFDDARGAMHELVQKSVTEAALEEAPETDA